MKKRKLLVLSLPIAIGIISVLGIAQFMNINVPEARYIPRKNAPRGAGEWNRAAEYYHSIRANIKTGKVELEDILQARQAVKMHALKKSGSLNLQWVERGPNNIGGRTRSIVVDKNNSNRVWAGSVSGGLFVSNNAGSSWNPVNDQFENLIVSSLTQAPDGSLWMGTGSDFDYSANQEGILFPGDGLFKSTDGANFTRIIGPTLPNNVFDGIYDTTGTSKEWASINRIAFKPGNSNEIYVAMNRGLRVSTDGGQTWINPIYANPALCSGPLQTVRGEDLDVTPDGRLFVSIDGVIYKSDNPSVCSTYTKVTGVPKGKRTEIAIAPSNSNYVYALTVDANGNFEGVYKSIDKGLNWTKILFPIVGYFEPMTNQGFSYGQGVYDLAFAVSPNNAEKIFIGGVQLWRYDGNLTRIAEEFGSFPPYYVHADKHLFTFDPNDPNTMYVGTDGGVFKSFDQGYNFFSSNKGYNVTQFYAMGFNNPAQGVPTTMIGGTQDNGSLMMTGATTDTLQGQEILGGDGFDADVSSVTGAMFATSYSVLLSRSSASGGTFALISADYINEGIFNTVTRLWESTMDNTSQDSITFKVDTTKQGIGTGNGNKKVFTGYLTPLQSSAKVVKGSLRIQVGTLGVTFNDFNNSTNDSSTFTSGNNSCTVKYSTREFTVTLANAPSVNTPVWAYFTTHYDMGTTLALASGTGNYPVYHTLGQSLDFGQSVKVQDPVQSILALGVVSSQGGIVITRNALKFEVAVDSTWMKLNIAGTPSCIEFSKDGNHMFYGVNQQGVWRVSGLNKMYAQRKIQSVTYTTGSNSTVTVVTTVPHNLVTGDSVNVSGVNSITTNPSGLINSNYKITVIDSKTFKYQMTNSTISGSFSAATSPNASATKGTLRFTKIFASNYAVTGIAVDNENPQNVVVTLGNYGHVGYVYKSTTAVSTINASSFTDASGDLPPMPVYDAEFINESSKVIVGTEYGVFATSDIFASPVQWTDENNGKFPHMPVFEVRQQKLWPSNNYEKLFVGTHGRGMWESGSLVTGVNDEEISAVKGKFISDLTVYPNPMNNEGFVVFNLKNSSIGSIRIFDLKGRNVKSKLKQPFSAGSNSIAIDADALPGGTYFITIETGEGTSVAKFVVVR